MGPPRAIYEPGGSGERHLFYLLDYVTLTEFFQIGNRKKKKKKET